MIDPKQIPPESWRKVQQLTGQPEGMCRLIAASVLNAWPGVARAYNYDDKAGWTALNDFNSQPTDGFILPLQEPRP
jgi:hypothetical protein